MSLRHQSFAPPKLKKCKAPGCSIRFQPVNTLHNACSWPCSLILARVKREREERAALQTRRRETKAALERIKTRREWLKDAQTAFNAWVRQRDAGLPCVSCGAIQAGQWDASHYSSIGAAPEIRFHPDNVHRACSVCNQHKSGNAIEYRLGLIKRIGAARVEWLEGPHEPAKWTIDEIKSIRDLYRAKLKELKARQPMETA
jgi:5-methylcytosine-specific restriction endonuclease McrA